MLIGIMGVHYWAPVQWVRVQRPRGEVFDISSFARIPTGQGQNLSYSPLPGGQLPPGEVAILFLAQFSSQFGVVPCPGGIVPALTSENAAVDGTIGDGKVTVALGPTFETKRDNLKCCAQTSDGRVGIFA